MISLILLYFISIEKAGTNLLWSAILTSPFPHQDHLYFHLKGRYQPSLVSNFDLTFPASGLPSFSSLS